MRRVLLALCLLTILGCSGVSSLIVQNKTNKDATVTIATRADPANQKQALRAPPGVKVHSEIYWVAQPPRALDVEVSLGGKRLHQTWDQRNYPPGLAQGERSDYYLEIHDDSLTLRGPNAWDLFNRISMLVVLMGSCLTVIVLAAIFLIVRFRKAKR